MMAKHVQKQRTIEDSLHEIQHVHLQPVCRAKIGH